MRSTEACPASLPRQPQFPTDSAAPRSTLSRKHDCTLVFHEIRPLEDCRWEAFVARHPRASVFHTSPWLRALNHTYGYQPIAYTTSPADSELQNSLLFCRVNSWLTGRRLVSVPFSDHCEPLVGDAADLSSLILAVTHQLGQDRMRYMELRPMCTALDNKTLPFRSTLAYCFHQLDLQPDLDALNANCHKSTRRNILRAEREDLRYEDGRSQSLLDIFFRLYVLTRRRHQAPPQPKEWFANLISCFGEDLKIRVAYRDGQALAAILTLRYKDTITYKYGSSDQSSSNLGGMHFLIWRTILEAKKEGLRALDLGRSECGNKGLITFKDRFGSQRSMLIYSRFAASPDPKERPKERYRTGDDKWAGRAAKAVVSNLPDRMFCTVGSLMYKHMA